MRAAPREHGAARKALAADGRECEWLTGGNYRFPGGLTIGAPGCLPPVAKKVLTQSQYSASVRGLAAICGYSATPIRR